MTCSKARFVFRPRVENLESRLQPGSVIVGQGYGWSLIDTLSILGPSSLDSHQLILQSSFESNRPAVASTPADVHGDHQDIAVAGAMAARSATSSPLTKAPVDNLAADLSNDDLGQLLIGGQRNKISLPATQNALAHQPISTAAAAGFVESPIGVATPTQAAANTTGGRGMSAFQGKACHALLLVCPASDIKSEARIPKSEAHQKVETQ